MIAWSEIARTLIRIIQMIFLLTWKKSNWHSGSWKYGY